MDSRLDVGATGPARPTAAGRPRRPRTPYAEGGVLLAGWRLAETLVGLVTRCPGLKFSKPAREFLDGSVQVARLSSRLAGISTGPIVIDRLGLKQRAQAFDLRTEFLLVHLV